MNKQILAIFIAAALIGALAGSIFAASFTKANPSSVLGNTNLLEDLFQKYLKGIFPSLNLPGFSPEAPATSNVTVPSVPTPPYTPTIDYEQAVIQAVEQASPAVVSIVISKEVPVIEQCPYNPFSNLPPEFQQFFGQQQFEFYQPCEKGTREQEVGGGSGFIISSDGLIVTNKHVVLDEGADYTVFTNDGKKYDASIISRDPVRDLAIIKIAAQNMPILRLGDSSAIKLGQTAIAIGNALGEFRNTVSVGVISGLARNVVASGEGISERIKGLIQTDAAINAGNSGGPLLNLKGEVIGINVAMVSGAQNIGFAIPINQVKRAIESVKRTGQIITPFLGARYILITPELAKKEKLEVETGALVRGTEDGPGVLPDSPAAKAGLQAEDIILEISDEKITPQNSLALIIQKYNVGDTITLKVLRAGQEINLAVRLEQRPKNL